MTSEPNLLDESTAEQIANELKTLRNEITNVIFGQEKLIDLVMVAMLARGHLLLEGLPGLGKTELVKAFSKALQIKTNRVQFTPDLLPGDITGNPMLQEIDGSRKFIFEQGPVFTNLLLADEINRASPKTQSALLEAMQEKRVTVMGETHSLPSPFFVFATQNPIELEGTYPLPEAQLDRFLFKLEVTHSDVDTLERIITNRPLGEEPTVNAVLDGPRLSELSAMSQRVFLPDVVGRYIARLVHATSPGNSKAAEGLRYGASPRAAIGLAAASRAKALLEGRAHASCDDVQAIAQPILGHRIIVSYQARMRGQSSAEVVASLLEEVPLEEQALPQSLTAAKIS
ncbi:MoxR family ATPase [Rubellicoccus peritrichatus]|uniref:MoxR family ATPase n=1 Tax=Rubellicoccus peritrichatus TaxID=3080537 RepID=A0AAQ3L693_9BACT|nr:MoxR family ATPase [Puniceicoccus sp. CR14]WOO39711.1 MoxR family ATPase [Puniceicoccus sp. CR14]